MSFIEFDDPDNEPDETDDLQLSDADFDALLSLPRNGEKLEMAELLLRAERGEIWAVAECGQRYLEDGDVKSALPWLERAANGGDPGSMTDLGLLYWAGIEVSEDPDRAFLYFADAADKGYPEGMTNLAIVLMEGRLEEEDYEKVLRLLHHAASCDQADPDAAYQLSNCYFNGLCGLERDPGKGVEWLEKAVELGSSEAQVALGRLYAEGKYVEADLQKAFEHFRIAAVNEDPDGMYNLAKYFLDYGEKSEDALESSLFWFQSAAEKGLKEAMRALACGFLEGAFGKVELDEAEKWALEGLAMGELECADLLTEIEIRKRKSAGNRPS